MYISEFELLPHYYRKYKNSTLHGGPLKGTNREHALDVSAVSTTGHSLE